jgi:AraC-like DNA-binding protein
MQRDPAGRNPLESFYVVHARSAEQMRHALLTDFGARSFDVSTRAGPFESRGHDCILNHTRFSYCSYNTKVRLEFPESTTVRQHFLLNGNSETKVGRSRLVMERNGDSYVIPDQAETQTTHAGDFRQLVVRIDTRALTSKLSAVLGASPGRTLRFDPQDDSGRRRTQHLQHVVPFIVRELDRLGPNGLPWVLAELEQTLMVYFLAENHHNYSDLLEREPVAVAPWQVRRAEEFITENWQQPISVEAIAAATGASVRSIFKSFRSSRGYSPMAYVKRIRLEHARDMLRTADMRASVTAIALACGFQNLGHFARDYRACFGELPSETLKGNKSKNRKK